MVDVFKAGDPRISGPNFTAAPDAGIKNVIKAKIDDPTVAKGHDGLPVVFVDQLFQKGPHPGPKMDHRLAVFLQRVEWGKRPFAAPEISIIGQGVVGVRPVIPLIVAYFANAVFILNRHPVSGRNRGGRFPGPLHRTGIDDVRLGNFGRQPFSQRLRLCLSQRG